MPRVKIAQVITRLDWSGSPDIIRTICSRLDPEEYDITLITGPTLHFSEKTKEFLNDFKGRVETVSCLKREINIPEDLSALVKLYRLFRRGKFDMVHTHTAKAGFIGRLAARMAGVPVVIHTPHGHNFYGYFNSLKSGFIIMLERIAAFFADRIVVFTDLEKRDMIKYKICGASRIDVITSGIDPAGFDNLKVDAKAKRAQFGIGGDDFIVGMISRLETVKGPEYFIESAKFIAAELPMTKFLVVGDGALKESLMARAARLNIADKIKFAGWREDIPEILSILDVMVLPSLNEAVGRVLLEAGLSAKPVVATDVGGIPAVLKNGKTGILVPPMDAGEIAEAVISLLKDAKKRDSMGRAAKAWVRGHFGESEMMSQLQKIYKEAAKI